MFRMFVTYGLAIGLILLGLGTLAYEGYVALTMGLASASFPMAAGLGVAPLVVGRLALWRARARRRRIETRHREQILLDLARRRGGKLDAASAARSLDTSAAEAQRLLEDLVRKGYADIEVADDGVQLYKLDERRLLGP
jgi:hypothetical protein